MQQPRHDRHLAEVAALFLKLGLIAYGGPAANIALMRNEVVLRRRWLDEQQFLDLLGAANLIPGPTSTELAIYLGYSRAGVPGLFLAGVLFILPAMLLVLAFAWAYVSFGSLPETGSLLYGIKPVIIAVILQAILGLFRTAVKSWLLGLAAAVTLALYLVGWNPLVPLFGAAVVVMVMENRHRIPTARREPRTPPPLLLIPWQPLFQAAPPAAAGLASFSLLTLFLTFLKIGATLFGSGYVLLAFLQDDFVNRLHWLTDQQILDAVAVGQFTPGPVFTSATFIGYLTGGVAGAIIATVGIFLPAFVFAAIVFPWVPKLRSSPWSRAFLDGANAAAIGLMVAVAWQLGIASIVDVLTAFLAVVAAILLIRFRVNAAVLVVGGGAVGLASGLVHL